ncbi:trypsin-like peptidase domain-containing protein [Streptomyces gamaensis]|uniref:Trypsin-like peptidase domain-containing protein n=1 Tax=Streptomyces gamaensis TaxID=1763542 RepID=A0ABW0YXM6_9ACTN
MTDRAATNLTGAVAQILDADGAVAGAGFVVADDILVTCAHVVQAAGHGPGDTVWLAFPHAAAAGHAQAHVLTEAWRPADAQDVAVLRLRNVPPGVAPLPLGSAAGCRGHRVRAYGFPAQAPPGGHFGYAVAGDLLTTGNGPGALLQLTAANDLTTGFSGGPLIDGTTGLAIGMVTSIAAPDQHLKGLAVAYATPTEVLRQAWPELAERQVCPYRGLEPFTAEHAEWFHGREAAVESVLGALGRHRRLLMLLGPSGAGKSSLVQAGVLPALAAGRIPGSDRWLSLVARPGRNLLAELERAGLPGASTDGLLRAVRRRLDAEPSCSRLVLVIDQFEELLTQSGLADGRLTEAGATAVKALAAANDPRIPVSVLLVMRDDFYPRLAALAPDLLEAVTPGLLNVPASLSSPELHAIISRPAQAVGLRVEDGLPERIITDVLAATADRHASVTLLPPLELALSQLWERRSDGRLTHHAYQQIGGIAGSLTTWCNTALSQLPGEQRPIAQRLLTALVRPADDTRAVPATRQQVPLDRLRALAVGSDSENPAAGSAFDTVLAELTRHRIVTTGTTPQPDGGAGEPTAELIHDALIRDWGELRDWVAQDHRFQVWLHRAAEQQRRHADSGLPEDLLHGTALVEGTEWAQERSLPPEVTTFLAASRTRREAVARRGRRIKTVLAGILAIVLVLGSLYVYQRQVAEERDAVANSRSLAQNSADQQGSDPVLAAKLALAAYDSAPTQEARNALLRNYIRVAQMHRTLSGTVGGVAGIQASRDGNVVMVRSRTGKSTIFVNAVTGTVRSEQVDAPGLSLNPLVSGDGKRAGLTMTDGSVAWYDIRPSGSRILGPLHRLPAAPEIKSPFPYGDYKAAMSDDGHLVAAVAADKPDTIVWWNTDSGRIEGKIPAPDHASGHIAFGADGRSLLAGTQADDARRVGLVLIDRAARTSRTLVDQADSYVISGDATAVVTCQHDDVDRVTLSSRRISDGTEQGHYSNKGGRSGDSEGMTCQNLAADSQGLLVVPTGFNRRLQLIDLQHGRVLSRMDWDHPKYPSYQSLVRSGDKVLLISAGASSVNITSMPSSDLGAIGEVALTADGKREVVVLKDSSRIQIRDAGTGRVLAESQRPEPHWKPNDFGVKRAMRVQLHERRNLLAEQVGKDSIAIRDLSTLRQRSLIRVTPEPEDDEATADHHFMFDREGNLLTSSGTVIQQWDSLTGRELTRYDAAPLRQATDSVFGESQKTASLYFTGYPGAHQVVIVWAGNPDIHVVDLRNGHVTARYTTGPDTIAVKFDPSSRYFAVMRHGSTIELWRRSPLRKELGPLPITGESEDRYDVGHSGFLDGEGRFFYSYGNKVRVYRVGDRSYDSSWDLGEEAAASSTDSKRKLVDVSRDGKTLMFTTRDENGVQLLPLQPEAWRRKLCDVIGNREFTREERDSLPARIPSGPLCRAS